MSERRADRPVFDASAVLAPLQDEPGSQKLSQLQAEAVVGAVNAAEVLARLVSRGTPVRQAEAVLGAIHLEVVPFDAGMAAGSARYVSPGVSLGDRCFLATAHRYGPGWTSDRELEELEGTKVPSLHFFR